LLSKRGKRAFEKAQKIILESKVENHSVREALCYFVRDVWHDLEYPGFMALACMAVGGKPEKTVQLGASLTLLKAAMDIHDDIIDGQIVKASKPTLFGKYGQDLSIIAGDVLFYEGLMQLNKAILQLPEKERQTIADLVKKALFEVGTGVASEVNHRGDFNLLKEDLMKIITQKSACADMHARLGGIIGGGSKEEVDALGRFGRLFGVLTNIRDEFIDIYESEELQNRKDKECLPLPLLFAFQENNIKSKIVPILRKKRLSDEDSQRILNIISQSQGIKDLKNHMDKLKEKTLTSLKIIRDRKYALLLSSLLDPIYEDILDKS
jgi:geranylgeranyl pyrophosphate synthase